jgi:hypothetical protein
MHLSIPKFWLTSLPMILQLFLMTTCSAHRFASRSKPYLLVFVSHHHCWHLPLQQELITASLLLPTASAAWWPLCTRPCLIWAQLQSVLYRKELLRP